METTALARIPLLLLACAETAGLDRAQLLREMDLREEELADPDRRIPEKKIELLWRRVIDALPGQAVGLDLVPGRALQDWGLVGCTMAYSNTLGDALHRFARYIGIMNHALVGKLNERQDRAEVIVDGPPRLDALRHPVDVRCAIIVDAARKLTGIAVVPVEVTFRHPQPDYLPQLSRFFRCPLRFDRPQTIVAFHRQDLERPIQAGDGTLTRYLDQLADQTLESLQCETSFEETVHRALWSEMSGGAVTLERVARNLGMSPRTLQRRLAQHRTSFTAMLDAFRRDTATSLLRDASLAIYEVAYLLGYTEPSTFYHAFRRWHGQSPREFRRSLT